MYPIGSVIASTLNGFSKVLPYLKQVHDDKVLKDREAFKFNNSIDDIIIKIHNMSDNEKFVLIKNFVFKFNEEYPLLCLHFENLISDERTVYRTLLDFEYSWPEPLQFLNDYQNGTKLEVIST